MSGHYSVGTPSCKGLRKEGFCGHRRARGLGFVYSQRCTAAHASCLRVCVCVCHVPMPPAAEKPCVCTRALPLRVCARTPCMHSRRRDDDSSCARHTVQQTHTHTHTHTPHTPAPTRPVRNSGHEMHALQPGGACLLWCAARARTPVRQPRRVTQQPCVMWASSSQGQPRRGWGGGGFRGCATPPRPTAQQRRHSAAAAARTARLSAGMMCPPHTHTSERSEVSGAPGGGFAAPLATRTHAHKDARTHARMQGRTHARTNTRTHTRMHARTHVRTRAHTHAHAHTLKCKGQAMHACVCVTHWIAGAGYAQHVCGRVWACVSPCTGQWAGTLSQTAGQPRHTSRTHTHTHTHPDMCTCSAQCTHPRTSRMAASMCRQRGQHNLAKRARVRARVLGSPRVRGGCAANTAGASAGGGGGVPGTQRRLPPAPAHSTQHTHDLGAPTAAAAAAASAAAAAGRLAAARPAAAPAAAAGTGTPSLVKTAELRGVHS
jgi:hypothetical protein